MQKRYNFSEEAFKKLYDEYKNRLYGYVFKITHSTHAAEEITQELFIKLWIDRERIPSIENIEHYIFVMAKNKTLNFIRKEANNAKALSELKRTMAPAANNVEELMIREDYGEMVEEALNQLSPQRSLVFRLSRYQGLKLDEIAYQLDLSRNTVKNHLVAALHYIRSYLTKHGVTLLWILLFFLR